MTNELPVPGLEPQLEPQEISLDDYWNLPSKLEFVGGFLIDPLEKNQRRDRLLAVLLRNQGLIRVIKMAPKELWEQAFEHVYRDSNT